jgi:uncharacterized glyoxalase superfamily protein PhnB
MTDPFDVLRIAHTPITPRPEFAAGLRRTLEQTLENTMTDTRADTRTDTASMTASLPQTITAYLSVRNAAAALTFYTEAFDAVEQTRLVGDDGRVGHSEIIIGSSKLMLADEYPEADIVGPETRGGPTCSFTIEVPDVDASFRRAVGAGATIERPVAEQFHGNRMGTLRDPFGHRWTLSTPIAGFDRAEYVAGGKEAGFELIESAQLRKHRPGDLYYFSLPVHDVAKAQSFFGAVLGWQFADPQQGHVTNISAPPGGVAPIEGHGSTSPQLWFVVDDIHTAVAKVRELGGQAAEPVLYDSGWSAECVDDQGTVFNLSVPAAKYSL